MDSNQHGPDDAMLAKTMAHWIAQKQGREPIMDCFDDNCLNPVGYRATSGWLTIRTESQSDASRRRCWHISSLPTNGYLTG